MSASDPSGPRARPDHPAVVGPLAAENDHLKLRVAVLTAVEQRFRAMLCGIGDGVIVTDLQGRVQQMNRVAESLTGWTEAEAAGRMVHEVFKIINEQDRREVENPIDKVVREGAVAGLADQHTLLIARDGTERAIADSAVPVRDGTGTMAGVVLIFRDVSAERIGIKPLRDNERILGDILESTLSGYWDWNLAAGTEYLSPTFKKMFGYEDHELLNAPETWQKLIFAEDLPGVLENFERHVRSRGSEPFYNEVRYRHRNGSTVWVICAGRVIEWAPDGSAVRMVGCHVDITGRKLTEARLKTALEDLQSSNRELEEFAYVASHDLQEPLRKISAFGGLLVQECGAAVSADGRDYLDHIMAAVKRMQTLINDLLQLSRIATRAKPFAPVDLNETLREVLEDLDARLKESGGTVTVEPLPALDADATQMRQIFQNLIANALKFRKPGEAPVVQVKALEVDKNANRAVLCVEDHGIGFEPRFAERIFGLFQRLHGRQQYEGTGIGLAVCRRIVERHGGRITAEGRLGDGATFRLELPMRHDNMKE
jgi:PAS domain S-box-containing protein